MHFHPLTLLRPQGVDFVAQWQITCLAYLRLWVPSPVPQSQKPSESLTCKFFPTGVLIFYCHLINHHKLNPLKQYCCCGSGHCLAEFSLQNLTGLKLRFGKGCNLILGFGSLSQPLRLIEEFISLWLQYLAPLLSSWLLVEVALSFQRLPSCT